MDERVERPVPLPEFHPFATTWDLQLGTEHHGTGPRPEGRPGLWTSLTGSLIGFRLARKGPDSMKKTADEMIALYKAGVGGVEAKPALAFCELRGGLSS